MIEALALRLREAYRDDAVAPLRDGLEPTDAAGAYAVQALNTDFWVGAGDTRAILIELGKRKMVGGQEDMITDVALDTARARETTND